jgi:riboflavin transporter FmnP
MKTKNIILTALFIALALILPFITMQIPQFGRMLTPMHFPVLIAGIVLGPLYGALVGIISPILRMTIFGMPQLLMAICMSFELLTYGLVIGLLKNRLNLYLSLIIALILGRIVYAFIAMLIMNTPFIPTLLTTFTSAIIGILLQFILIPQIIKRI